jgi:hypothetical protein
MWLKYYETSYYKFNFNSLITMGHMNFIHVPFKTISDADFPVLESIGQGCFSQNRFLTSVNLSGLKRIKSTSQESIDQLFADDYPSSAIV